MGVVYGNRGASYCQTEAAYKQIRVHSFTCMYNIAPIADYYYDGTKNYTKLLQIVGISDR